MLTEEEFGSIENELEDVSLPEEREEMELEEEKVTPVDGVEALKALLKVLSNEDVAATLKGMNLSINISFGDKSEK